MNLIVSTDKYYSDEISRELVEYINNKKPELDNAVIYYEYPIYMDIEDQALSPKILLISPSTGVLVVNCSPASESNDVSILDDETSQIENYLFSKFIKSKCLRGNNKRELSFTLQSVLYLPLAQPIDYDVENTICKEKNEILSMLDVDDCQLTEDEIKEICAILEGSKAILKPKVREISLNDTTSKGYILNKMEQQIAYLDKDQKHAALSQINGPQRIRGLAGSGKTIILCMKAALIHLREPEKKILYTFLTKSLYDYIETMIIRFYKLFGDGSLPDFNKIQIKHSWGGENVSGVYYSACKNNNIVPLTFQQAKEKAFIGDPFDVVCEDLLEKTAGILAKEYDYVLIDEAQDFQPPFYQLCRAIVKDDCLVWCYDDLQNIYDVKIQDTIKTFENKYGAKGIDLVKLNEQYEALNNDVVLAKTYRNPREILVLAHAIGFGIYNDSLIQSLENKQHWIDFGYNVLEGDCRLGDRMVIERPRENSPLIVSDLQSADQIIELKSLESSEQEIRWIAESIEYNIRKENVRPDDIIVICLDDKNSKAHLRALSTVLNFKDIHTFNITNSFYSKGFIEEGAVTLSTVYKAKGNEAAIVYVMGTQVFQQGKNRRSMRNKIFTAFTRAKGWLKISGVDIEDGQLWKEIVQVINDNFTLKFIQTEPKFTVERGKKATGDAKIKKKIEELKQYGYNKEDISSILEEIYGDKE
ncbi:MAG: ATP-binding domain-containing protein [Ruminococcus flavefaciens]|nr:ATP-binding domain-containing protein [Ruminococcus flavefaciens]